MPERFARGCGEDSTEEIAIVQKSFLTARSGRIPAAFFALLFLTGTAALRGRVTDETGYVRVTK